MRAQQLRQRLGWVGATGEGSEPGDENEALRLDDRERRALAQAAKDRQECSITPCGTLDHGEGGSLGGHARRNIIRRG